mmetsp:Transcript_20981/g.20099  ORF Transcript_20981/g.20099 Transcript_20981/m.20099 type:complete len:125 (+) Transcript_20981:3-377(+)
MKVLVKIYADDLKSPSLTHPLFISASKVTIAQLKKNIEQQIRPQIKVKDQILSTKQGKVIMRLEVEESLTLEEAGLEVLQESSSSVFKVHVQDSRAIQKKGKCEWKEAPNGLILGNELCFPDQN